MTDKELDDYMKTVNPNFDSHIEKGTIEMNNEYYNLLEEKMARLINQNQKLKQKYENAVVDYESVMSERCELKRQNNFLRERENKLQVLEMKEKEFIKYLEDEKDRLAKAISHYYIDSFDRQHAVNETVYDEVDVILQKYKEIIGVLDDKTN